LKGTQRFARFHLTSNRFRIELFLKLVETIGAAYLAGAKSLCKTTAKKVYRHRYVDAVSGCMSA
jgi:hypothetical protein